MVNGFALRFWLPSFPVPREEERWQRFIQVACDSATSWRVAAQTNRNQKENKLMLQKCMMDVVQFFVYGLISLMAAVLRQNDVRPLQHENHTQAQV